MGVQETCLKIIRFAIPFANTSGRNDKKLALISGLLLVRNFPQSIKALLFNNSLMNLLSYYLCFYTYRVSAVQSELADAQVNESHITLCLPSH